MTDSDWLKFYNEALQSYRYCPKDAPTFEQFKARQIEFMRQCANQPLGDLSAMRVF